MEELHAAILAYLRDQRAPDGGPVLVYARVALDEAGVPTLAAQEVRCRAYARARGWAVAGALREAHDGASVARPALRALLERGNIAAVLVASLDRLAPDPAVVERLRAELAAVSVALRVAGPPEG